MSWNRLENLGSGPEAFLFTAPSGASLKLPDLTAFSRHSELGARIGHALWGNATCALPNGGVKALNPQTRFMTVCFITAVAVAVSLVSVVPVLIRLAAFRHVESSRKTVLGQLSTVSALLAPILATYHSALPHAMFLVSGVGFLVGVLHFVQDGRVTVTGAELLLYWSVMALVYVSWAIDAYLRNTGGVMAADVWRLVGAAALALVTLGFETWSPERTKLNRFDDINIFQRATVSYATPLMNDPASIDHKRIMAPPPGLDSRQSYEDFQRDLARYPPTARYRVLRALFRGVGRQVVAMILLTLTVSLINITYPVLLRMFLTALIGYSRGTHELYEAYYLAFVMSSLPLISSSIEVVNTTIASFAETKVRSALMTSVYRKAVKLSPAGRERFEAAKIMNMMSVDTQQIFTMVAQLPAALALPTTMVLSFLQLWNVVGPSFATGFLAYLLVVPLSSRFTKALSTIMPRLSAAKDERTKLTTNAIRCVKTLKLHAWELPFYHRITELRHNVELALNRQRIQYQIMTSVAWNCGSDLTAALVFASFLWLRQGVLSPNIMFPALNLLQMASGAILFLPQNIGVIVMSLTAQTRISELLDEPDDVKANYYGLKYEPAVGLDESAIVFDHADVSWNGELSDDKVALKDVSFRASRGDLICVVGRVGTGKSALLGALCGDLAVVSGEVTVKGQVAYCTQDAWLQNYSIQENITFGQTFDEAWYNEVVAACELAADIAQMPDGGQTEVGERGISLSGGQKARVSLARAVYSRADVIVLDDVLSAVDEHVGSALITKLFSGSGMLASRTVVLATNNVRVLAHSSLILLLQDKQVGESVSFKDVVRQGEQSQVYRLVQEFGHKKDLEQEAEHMHERRALVQTRLNADPAQFPPDLASQPSEVSVVDIRREADEAEAREGNDTDQASVLGASRRYLIGDRPWRFIFGIVFMVFSTILMNGCIAYLGMMSNQYFETLGEGKYYILGYITTIVLAGGSIYCVLRYFELHIGQANARAYHDQMLWSVLRSPMGFFDVTPIGRIVNRFTGDLATLDYSASITYYYSVRSLINLITVLGGICLGSPVLVLPILPLMWFADASRAKYTPTQRRVTRIMSAANSPILSLIEDTLKGLSTIRAFSRQDQFMDIFNQRVDYWTKSSYYRDNLTMWLQLRVQFLTASLLLLTSLAGTHLVGVGRITTGHTAVMLNFAQRAGVMVRQTISFFATVETNGVSLDRIHDYMDIAQEAPAFVDATKPADTWPATGTLDFDGLSARYTDSGPDVLKNLSFRIDAGEKIGVVGRTGSGKSTLTMALFRIIEASKGHINLDDVDTSLLGLSELRSRLSIIPQDSQILNSSVRENLDPLKTRTDEELWRILELCHMKDHFAAYDGLDTELTDSGGTLSRGQAQLLCLGRALAHKSKILVLDEATASVDHETDSVVQETIRAHFAERTIITIAHRLNTIMDSDRILVLDKGEVKEFDTPTNLLAAKGLFWGLHNTEESEMEKEMDS